MNKKQILSVFFISGILVFGTFTSCKKDFLDINQNPNSPADVTVRELLPSAEAAIAHTLGNNFAIYAGLWAQYWTQSPASSQYKTFEQYSPGANDFDRSWKSLYADALQDLKTIESKATTEGLPNYTACAKILEAYAFQLATDNFGDVPFSEALQGASGILSPHYDSQQAVYSGIISLLDDALAIIAQGDPLTPGDDDILLAGDMALWQEFAYTLKLRVYMRLSEIDPATAQAGIAALEAAGAVFLGPGEEVRVNYLSSGGNTNPLYSSIVDVGFTQNLVASSTAIDYMITNNDTLRLYAFYTPAANGSQVGIAQGDYTVSASTPVSVPSPLMGGDANDETSALAPVKLMTGYESLFLQAEAVARGWLTGNEQTLYEDAITENFESYGLDAADAVAYFGQPSILYPIAGTLQNKLEAIITQKWIAMCGNQNDEGWIEQRRTGYPNFFTQSVNSIIGGGRFPERFYYPNTELTRNGNFPGQELIYTRVWWDIN